MAYSALEHIARSAWLSSFDWNNLMVMFTAYFDESAQPTVLGCAGYVATTKQWVNFEADWRKLLQWAKIPDGEPFHMTDFDCRANGTIYEHWSDDKRIAFMQRAIGIIRKRVKIGISNCLHLGTFNECIVNPVREAGLAGAPRASFSPYSSCMMQCIKLVERWCNQGHRQDPIAYFFESGAALSGHLENALQSITKRPALRKRYRMGTWAFGSKHEHVPFQAADILAYETTKYWDKYERFGSSGPRPSIKNLLTIPTIEEYQHADYLREYIESLGTKNTEKRIADTKKWIEKQRRRQVKRMLSKKG